MSSDDFHVDVVERGSVVRARIEGKLDAATLPAFLEVLEPLAATAQRLVLDCSTLGFCDSSGLRGIVILRNTLGPAGRVALEDVSDGLRQILAITGLTALLGDGDQTRG